MMREGFILREASEICVEQKRDADGDQHGAQKERESYAEEKADGVFAFGGRDSGGEHASGADVFLAAENRAEDVDVGGEPEFDFVARLPEQVDASANHERADDGEKLGHGYRPRPRCARKIGERALGAVGEVCFQWRWRWSGDGNGFRGGGDFFGPLPGVHDSVDDGDIGADGENPENRRHAIR